jgi:hypothetical protein
MPEVSHKQQKRNTRARKKRLEHDHPEAVEVARQLGVAVVSSQFVQAIDHAEVQDDGTITAMCHTVPIRIRVERG